jgi:hypothetical protein
MYDLHVGVVAWWRGGVVGGGVVGARGFDCPELHVGTST